MKTPTYDELWELAFIDKKTQCFNKNYFDYYIRRSGEYRECSIIVGTMEDLKNTEIRGYTFIYNDKFFRICSYETELEEGSNCKMYKKFRVSSWSDLLKRALK